MGGNMKQKTIIQRYTGDLFILYWLNYIKNKEINDLNKKEKHSQINPNDS